MHDEISDCEQERQDLPSALVQARHPLLHLGRKPRLTASATPALKVRITVEGLAVAAADFGSNRANPTRVNCVVHGSKWHWDLLFLVGPCVCASTTPNDIPSSFSQISQVAIHAAPAHRTRRAATRSGDAATP